ncbi:MAG: hypothetical protein NTNFB02_12090 [Nitrospira sp.]
MSLEYDINGTEIENHAFTRAGSRATSFAFPRGAFASILHDVLSGAHGTENTQWSQGNVIRYGQWREHTKSFIENKYLCRHIAGVEPLIFHEGTEIY